MKRLHSIVIIFYVWFAVIALRLFFWQIISHTRLSNIALMQHQMQSEITAKRGSILAQDGSPLVTNQVAYVVYANPQEFKKNTENMQTLSKLLTVDEASLSAKLKPNLYWVALQRKVSQDQIDELKIFQIPGIGYQREDIRMYPEGSMSAQLFGFVGSGYDGQPKGYFGIEEYYDKELKGRPGYFQQSRSASGNPILAGESQRVLAENGGSLKLYVDKTIQFTAEKKLHEGIQKYGAKGGTILVMDPKTGGILAMAGEPNYNPAIYSVFDESSYKNPNVADAYEPGSTFKVLVMAAAIEEKANTPDTTFNETGPIAVAGNFIKTWNDKYAGIVTATQILEKSSNVGMVQIERLLGHEKFLQYIKKFGFGKETGIDLADELSPSLRNDSEWKDIDYATASFGQGIAVTPLQMVQAVSAIANGGAIYQPRVVKAVINDQGQEMNIQPRILRTIMSPQTAKYVADMMVASVEHAEAKFDRPLGYRIAGKTGTAQIPVQGHYDPTKTIASFIGFAPADDAKFIILVRLIEPTTSQWGSETAAPIFFSLTKELLAYYKIPPK